MFMLSLDDWPGVFLRWDDDRGPSVGVSPQLGQNSEQTSAAGKKQQLAVKTFEAEKRILLLFFVIPNSLEFTG